MLKKYKIKEKDIKQIASHIEEMCFKAYCNGRRQEAWNTTDYDV